MNGRLYRLTPAGGKPNHYTDSLRSAQANAPSAVEAHMIEDLDVGEGFDFQGGGHVERVA